MTRWLAAVLLALIFALVGALDLEAKLTDEAVQKDPPVTWIVGEGRRPVTLEDCAGFELAISYNSGAYAPWKQFCYSRPTRQGEER